MTQKQENFCSEYIANGGNASAACRAAGYSERSAKVTGSRLLKRSDIREKIDNRLDEIKSTKIVDETAILEFLSDTMRGEIEDIVVTPGGKKIAIPCRVSDRLRACEMLCKVYGLFKRDDEPKDTGANLFVETLTRIWEENPELHDEDERA